MWCRHRKHRHAVPPLPDHRQIGDRGATSPEKPVLPRTERATGEAAGMTDEVAGAGDNAGEIVTSPMTHVRVVIDLSHVTMTTRMHSIPIPGDMAHPPVYNKPTEADD